MDTAPYVEWPKPYQVLVKRIQNPFFAQFVLWRPVFKQICIGLNIANKELSHG
jgi:hypothetical protein